MKKFFGEILKSLSYVKKELIFALIIYSLGLLFGIFIFKDTNLETNPQNLGVGIILLNNIKVVGVIFILGLVTFGIGSSILLFINAAVLGGAVMGVYNMYSMKPIITGIFPHMILEIIGLLLCTAVSYETLKLLLNGLTKRKKKMVYIKKDIILLSLGLIFIILAAIVEGTISYI